MSDGKVTRLGGGGTSLTPPRDPTAGLPYVIELRPADGLGDARILGRAASISLARAIFIAAKSEHPGQRIVLLQGEAVLDETRFHHI